MKEYGASWYPSGIRNRWIQNTSLTAAVHQTLPQEENLLLRRLYSLEPVIVQQWRIKAPNDKETMLDLVEKNPGTSTIAIHVRFFHMTVWLILFTHVLLTRFSTEELGVFHVFFFWLGDLAPYSHCSSTPAYRGCAPCNLCSPSPICSLRILNRS